MSKASVALEPPPKLEEQPQWFPPSPHPHDWPVTGRVWIDMNEVGADNPDILDLARRMTRLTLFALNGMLVDMEGSILEKDDIRLIQEVAWTADSCVSAAGKRYLDEDGKERRPPFEAPRSAKVAS